MLKPLHWAVLTLSSVHNGAVSMYQRDADPLTEQVSLNHCRKSDSDHSFWYLYKSCCSRKVGLNDNLVKSHSPSLCTVN